MQKYKSSSNLVILLKGASVVGAFIGVLWYITGAASSRYALGMIGIFTLAREAIVLMEKRHNAMTPSDQELTILDLKKDIW